MKKSYLKIVAREIKQSFGRFAAIFAIVLLGVGFLFGLISTTPNMRVSVDSYYDKSNVYDINIKSTLGFNDDDIDVIISDDSVEELMQAHVMDVLVDVEGEVTGGRVYGLPFDDELTLNKLTIEEGRFPEKSNEIVVERSDFVLLDVNIGDTVRISEENEDIEDLYAITEFKIVGIVENPYYFQKQPEMTTVGNGQLGAIIYGNSNIYDMDVFTDLFLTVSGAKELNTFSDEYHALIKPLVEDFEELGEERANIRYDEIMEEALDEIEESRVEAEEEIEEARIDAEKEIEKERLEAEEEIEKGRLDGQYEINKGRAEGTAEIERNRATAVEEIEKGRDEAEKELEQNRIEAEAEIAESLELIELGFITDPEIIKEVEMAQGQIDEMIKQAQGEIDRNIQAAYEELDREIQGAYNQLNAEIQSAQTELNKGIEEAKLELDEGIQEAYAELEEEIEKAYIELNEEIQDAKEELEDLDEGKWYVLDRNANTSYVTFELNSGKVDSVVTVFPVFFYLVAALVSLTTMTRMVEEDRIQIGTLKALGYSRITIVSKYIIYCGLASVLGSLTGILLGMGIIPLVIWNAFDSLFHLPEFITTFNTKIALISSGIAVIGNMLVTVYVCNHILRENAAMLMLPKAPKPGKRILLERINFLWSRLSFNQKSTIRNIFRYKKHFFMTVIGISGCTALLLTGFGLRDSIGDLANVQFNEIIGYDLVVNFEDGREEIYDLLNRDEVIDTLELHTDSGEITYASQTEDLSIVSIENLNDLDGFIDLRDRKTGESLQIDNDSGIITEKIWETYQLNLPQSIIIENFDGDQGQVKTTHITENYVRNYIYISHETYEEAFDIWPDNNAIYVSMTDDVDDETKDDIINGLLRLDNVLSASFIDSNRDTFDNLLDNINYIVLVIIIASGGLAFIVLYNLTNININERKKELATFRVLGFYNEEVASYIFRETAILTLVGILVGLGLGTILHKFVILTVEDPEFMFGRDVKLISYGLSTLITMVFALIVNLFMSKKIRAIKMADSMKAND